jgi:replicative DNA helicase
MTENKKNDLTDSAANLYVLGQLMHRPLIIDDEKHILAVNDFSQPLQQIIFAAIYNMEKTGAAEITPPVLDLYLKGLPDQYQYYTTNHGLQVVTDCYNLITGDKYDEGSFDLFYNRVKKFSILRDLRANGFDVKPFYDTDKSILDRNEEDEKLDNTKIEDIPNRIRQILVEIEDRHVGKNEALSQDVGKGIRKLTEELEENPEIGLPLEGDILNFGIRGARLGKLYVYSAPSGAGKTRTLVGNACSISLPWIDNNNKIHVRDKFQKVLFVPTEMTVDEIQTLVLSYVSGVNEEHILLGQYTSDERVRLEMGIKILEKFGGNFIVECMPDPSRAEVRAKIAKYIIQDGIQYIFYDYIFSSPGLLEEFRDLDIREDVVLMMMSNTLKELAATYQVFIETATQLNGGWEKPGPRNQNLIRGSKAIVDKVDIGIIGVRLQEDEKEEVKDIIKGHGDSPEPNLVLDVYKNRRGSMSAIKIFRRFDYGTCHAKDLFVTDDTYHPWENQNGLKMGVVKYNEKLVNTIDEIPMEVMPDAK